jgi:hypothetical protein
MNRCLPIQRFFKLLALLLVWTLSFGQSPAAAQNLLRQFPATAKRGVLLITTPPEVLLDGKPARLSPGARIKSTNNLLVLSASLAGASLPVNYVLDAQGMLHEVWILTAQEAQTH